MILTEYDEKKHIKNEKQESWEEGKLEGESLFAKLVNKLISAGKNDDILKATTDPEYRQKLYVQYGIKSA